MKPLRIAIATLGIFFPQLSFADSSLIGTGHVTGGVLLKSTPYKTSEKLAIEGQIGEVGYNFKIAPKIALGLNLGLMFDGNAASGDANPNGGTGMSFKSDVRYNITRIGKTTFMATGTVAHDRFRFSQVSVDASFEATEFKLGGLAYYSLMPFAIYGGVEVLLYSDGQFDFGEISEKAKRESAANIRVGGIFRIDKKIALSADFLLLGETTMLFAADYRI